MNTLEQSIKAFERAAEELANTAAMSAINKKLDLTVEEGRALMDRIAYGERMGARAERSILEAVALGVALEVIKAKLAADKIN